MYLSHRLPNEVLGGCEAIGIIAGIIVEHILTRDHSVPLFILPPYPKQHAK